MAAMQNDLVSLYAIELIETLKSDLAQVQGKLPISRPPLTDSCGGTAHAMRKTSHLPFSTYSIIAS